MINHYLTLSLITLSLGIRHGFDLDHLATIDSITRNIAINQRYQSLAKLTGFLFSLGHGMVIIAISIIISLTAKHWQIPSWLDKFGNIISIFFLFSFGLWTLYSLLNPQQNSSSKGIKSFLFKKTFGQVNHPLAITAIGALFALSFDTFSQAVMFSLTATTMAGISLACGLGVIFMVGMMLADGLNSLLIVRLINYLNHWSIRLSQLLTASIALFSFSIGALLLLQTLNT